MHSKIKAKLITNWYLTFSFSSSSFCIPLVHNLHTIFCDALAEEKKKGKQEKINKNTKLVKKHTLMSPTQKAEYY